MEAIRHGDLLLVKVDKIPKGLKKSKEVNIMQGSGGNNHSINKGSIYFVEKDDFIIGYLKAKDTKLIHPEHGDVTVGSLKHASIPDGVYELRKQVEYTHDGMKQVID